MSPGALGIGPRLELGSNNPKGDRFHAIVPVLARADRLYSDNGADRRTGGLEAPIDDHLEPFP